MRFETRVKKLTKRFEYKFKTEPTEVFSSPGRIELLGNHTDHNNGKVLVSSVDLNIIALSKKRDDGKVVFYSQGYKKMEVSLARLNKKEKEYGTSLALIRGVLFKMKELGYKIGGFSVCSDSTIFRGAGVSSSAAFEVLIAKIESYYYNNDSIEPFKLAQIAQFSESVYFNKPCGLLDQTGIALGGVNFIDFKSLTLPEIKNLKVKIPNYQFLIINTGDDHTQLTHCYTEIKADMKAVANFFNKNVLREIDPNDFYQKGDEIKAKISERAYLRAKHYFEENERVQNAYDALKRKDYKTFLEMLDASGTSSYYQLKNCYVSNEEEKLPQALKFAKLVDPECYSRVHGGGFAGTMLMIVKKSKLKEVYPQLVEKFGKENVMKVSLSEHGTYLEETL